MRTVLSVAVAAVSFIHPANAQSSKGPGSVDQLHVLSIHVPDHKTFDAAFVFLRDTLGLPVAYGKPSSPSDSGRLYAGFSVGNAYLEPCGPYDTDAPFTAERPARFHGLTFSASKTIDDSAQALDVLKLAHSGVMGGGSFPRFVYLKDELLTGTFQAVSIWQLTNQNDTVSLPGLKKSLKKSGGGALGVKRLREVQIVSPGPEHLGQWSRFLERSLKPCEATKLGAGPALRFVPGEASRPECIELEVKSLRKAIRVLASRNVTGTLHGKMGDTFEIDARWTCGLRILLTE